MLINPLLIRPLLITAAILVPITAYGQSTTNQSTVQSPPLSASSLVETRWVDDARETMAARRAARPIKKRAKNVILFIADGMDPTTITAARIFDGQSRGESGEENFLAFETFPHLALAKTYTTNAQTPDSAGTATAMVTGVKTKSGVISLTDAVEYGNCASASAAMIKTVGELAEQAGLSTGVISTARLTHATPATVYAHAANRGWEVDSTMPQDAKDAGCDDIAKQLIEFPYGDGLEVAFGGGRRNFLPATQNDPENDRAKGARTDMRDLTREWTEKSDQHRWVWNKEGFDAITPDSAAPGSTPHVLGLFEPSHMQYELDRVAGDTINEPSLSEMTEKAIQILDRNKKGYFLMVEGGRIDHAHHAGNARRALIDAQAFSQAVAKAVEMTSDRETLIIVTADHGHTLVFQGYPKKGNDILGLAVAPDDQYNDENGFARAGDGKPYTTLGYGNGPGSVVAKGDRNRDGRSILTPELVAKDSFKQQAAIPMSSETHGGQDVTIYARGPHAYLLGGTVEQSYIFHVIEEALDLKRKASKQRR